MSDNYYDNSLRWVFDSDGNFLHSKRREFNPSLERDGYFYTNEKEWDEKFEQHQLESKNN